MEATLQSRARTDPKKSWLRGWLLEVSKSIQDGVHDKFLQSLWGENHELCHNRRQWVMKDS